MKQNIYDNMDFYSGYIKMRKEKTGLNDVLEIPHFLSLLPEIKNKLILDLGCGYGELSLMYIKKGARKVVGVDISRNMINFAKEKNCNSKIEFINQSIEDYSFPKSSFDLVLSSLCFHYIKDFQKIIRKIYQSLNLNGYLIFSQEHPFTLAKIQTNGWCKDKNNKKIHWIVDNYHEEGERNHNWIVDNVKKYHRTMANIINTLIEEKFVVKKILEPHALEEEENKNADLLEERRRPPFLFIKCKKE
jgi:SAM-dependent methyltransferase